MSAVSDIGDGAITRKVHNIPVVGRSGAVLGAIDGIWYFINEPNLKVMYQIRCN
jgi:hypothetical protein